MIVPWTYAGHPISRIAEQGQILADQGHQIPNLIVSRKHLTARNIWVKGRHFTNLLKGDCLRPSVSGWPPSPCVPLKNYVRFEISTNMKIRWVRFEQLEEKKLPLWLRTIAVALDGSEVFVPAAIGGNEDAVILCAAWDGAAFVRRLGHVYVPTSWLAIEFPDSSVLCELAAARARESLRRRENP